MKIAYSKRIWIDVITPSEGIFFSATVPYLHQNILFTAAESAETTSLLRIKGILHAKIGRHPLSRGPNRIILPGERIIELLARVPDFDLSLSFQDFYSVLVSSIRGRPSIVVADNDKVEQLHYRWVTLARATFLIVPEIMPLEKLTRIGIDSTRVLTFKGYKEDIYLAEFHPDPDFASNLPFKHYVVLRPEGLHTAYVQERRSIVRELCELLVEEGLNVVFLPRTSQDKLLASPNKHIFVPPQPLNGLDLCYNSEAVLTGSGTLAREAALLGVAAVSFFPGELLEVDAQMCREGRMFHSRIPSEIAKYTISSLKGHGNLETIREKSAKVRDEFLSCLDRAMSETFARTR